MAQQYGRGKFEAHENYISYMNGIVNHKNFADMPNAVSDGKINWQVSSGKNTSFYKYYLARWQWWSNKADELGLSGAGNDNERFTIAARKINPTGYRACRLCGKDFNIGYFYLNDRLFKNFSKIMPQGQFFKWQPIDYAILEIKKHLSIAELNTLFLKLFQNRASFFELYGVSKKAFERSSHINSKAWLTPGYMGNPPDRLDGFHDYHFECRKKHDPGRFDENMRSYNHDRRSFEFWAQGNWMAADVLYNSAGIGQCVDCPPEAAPVKISPDHIGPISCGFKQISYYKPLCARHNSSKNRRFTKIDIELLIDYEIQNSVSIASRQIQAHWDLHKKNIKNDNEAKEFSNSLRSIQDAYFRILYDLWTDGHIRFLCSLLSPEHAFDNVIFHEIEPSTLQFTSVSISKKITPNRQSLFVRSIRIGFESLIEYVSKPSMDRRLMRKDYDSNLNIINDLRINFGLIALSDIDKQWQRKLSIASFGEASDRIIGELTEYEEVPTQKSDETLRNHLENTLNKIGRAAQLG